MEALVLEGPAVVPPRGVEDPPSTVYARPGVGLGSLPVLANLEDGAVLGPAIAARTEGPGAFEPSVEPRTGVVSRCPNEKWLVSRWNEANEG